MINIRKTALLGSLAVASALTGSLAQVGTASAAPASPTIVVSPSTGLSTGQRVTVSGNGFPAGSTVKVAECAGSGSNVLCQFGAGQSGTADQNGAVTISATVFASFAGSDTSGNPAGTVNCADSGCWIAAASDAQNFAAPASISFG